MSFYSNAATRARDAREAKKAQYEREQELAEQRRQQQKTSSFKNVWTETDREVKEAQAKQEAKRLAPLLKAQKEQEQLFRTLRNAYAWLLSEPDPEFAVDRDAPHTVHGTFDKSPQQIADEYSEEQFELFVQDNPSYYRCQENAAILAQYLTLNGNILLVSAKTFKQAYDRLLDVGLMLNSDPVKPEVKEEPEPQTLHDVATYDFSNGQPEDLLVGWSWERPGERCTLTHAQLNAWLNQDERVYKVFCRDAFKGKPTPKKDDGEWGYERGEKVWKSNWEVTQMGSDEYRRFAKPRTNIDQLLVQPELVSDL